jgi:hypothetical protein
MTYSWPFPHSTKKNCPADFLQPRRAGQKKCSPQSRGLLDRSTALYFYKRLKTSLHKPRGNLVENLISKTCAFKNNLQLLEKKFLSQTNTTPKNGILLGKMA